MRILTVCTSTNVFGAEIVTLKLLEGFAQKGHEQLAVTSTWTDGKFNEALKSLDIAEVRLPFGAFSKRLAIQPMWWTFNFVLRLPWLWFGWRRVLSRFDPDVVLLTSSRLALPIYPWLARRPSFMIEHSYLEATRTRRLMYLLLARKLVGFVAVSNFMAEQLARIGAPARQIHVIHNGLFNNADLTKNRSARVGPIGRPARIGIVGQISRSKGHAVLVEALRILRESRRQVEVYAFGAGNRDFISTLSAKLAEYGLSSFWHWEGYESDVDKIYKALDICVMPSSNEPFGLVAIEASAYGLPVIVSDRGGLREIVDDGVNGLLTDPDNPEDLALKITRLLDDPDLARYLGIEGQKRVLREFTQGRMVAGYENLFSKAMEPRVS